MIIPAYILYEYSYKYRSNDAYVICQIYDIYDIYAVAL